jgi:Flp pilus assembly protein TadG
MRKRLRTRRSGAAALEMAIILPIMITIALGCVDYGRFSYMNISVANAAGAGARLGAINPISPSAPTAIRDIWNAKIVQAVQDEMSQQTGYNQSDLTVDTPVLTTDSNGLRRVRVRVSYRFNTIVSWPLLPTSSTLSRSVEMRQIR